MNKIEAISTAPTILVLHPDALVGVMIEELLVEAGVGTTYLITSEEEAVGLLASTPIDGAVLGINTHNEEIQPIAALLKPAGVPFIVSGSLTKLPDTDGLNEVPIVSALAGPNELAAAFAAVGVNIASQGDS